MGFFGTAVFLSMGFLRPGFSILFFRFLPFFRGILGNGGIG